MLRSMRIISAKALSPRYYNMCAVCNNNNNNMIIIRILLRENRLAVNEAKRFSAQKILVLARVPRASSYYCTAAANKISNESRACDANNVRSNYRRRRPEDRHTKNNIIYQPYRTDWSNSKTLYEIYTHRKKKRDSSCSIMVTVCDTCTTPPLQYNNIL